MPIIHDETCSSRGPCVVITGANSHLGSRAVSRFADLPGSRVIALVSPRWQEGNAPRGTDGVEVIRADLGQPLADRVREALCHADRVFHFAWARGRDLARVGATNEAMVRQLIDPLSAPSRFVFISSVAGCPGTPSGYGTAKGASAALVRELGGTVLVCGLVMEHIPSGPYELLCGLVRKLPFSIRLFRDETQVFPILAEDLVNALVAVTVQDLTPGTYKLFGAPSGFNTFLEELERRHPRRRVPVWIPTRVLLGMISWAKRLRILPWRVSDKILTFLYKDQEYLMAQRDLPDVSFARWQDQYLTVGPEKPLQPSL